MKERVLPFLGGLLIGIALGLMADAYPYYAALAADPNRGVALMVGNAVVGFAAGALAAWKIGGREKRGLEVRGLRYPQGPMYLRAAFKRMGAILGEER